MRDEKTETTRALERLSRKHAWRLLVVPVLLGVLVVAWGRGQQTAVVSSARHATTQSERAPSRAAVAVHTDARRAALALVDA
jgi:hypothetical protein